MLNFLTDSHKKEWNAILSRFSEKDIYWRVEYGEVNKQNDDDIICMFHYTGKKSEAVYLTSKRKIRKKIDEKEYYDLITPYGYGGWLVKGDTEDEMYDSFDSWCVENGIVSEFVRFHPILHNERYATHYDVRELGSIVTVLLKSKEQIWENIDAKNKNAIRKAIKLGVEVRYSNDDRMYDLFQEMYCKTMMRKQADDFYLFKKSYFSPFKTSLVDNNKLFYAVFNGRIIAMCMMMFEAGVMNYHLSCSDADFRGIPATNLILYEAEKWGLENNVKLFSLGGGLRSTQDSLYQFKKSFARYSDDETFRIGSRIILPRIYDELSKEIVDGGNFFPKYRA